MSREFDGSTQYLEHGTAIITSEPLTMLAWFKPDVTNATQCLMAIADSGANTDWWRLEANSVGNVRLQAARSSGYNAISTGSYVANTWQMACATIHSSTDRRVFRDGGNKGTNTTNATPISLDNTTIGRITRASPGFYMDGSIAEVALWNIALSDEEVAELYNGGVGLSPLLMHPEALVAYWPLVGDDDDRDMAGAYAMTAYNTPTHDDHPPMLYPGGVLSAQTAAATVQLANTTVNANENIDDTTTVVDLSTLVSNLGGTATYSITVDTDNLFEVNSSTGIVTLQTGKGLDYAADTQHSITCKVVDSDGADEDTNTVTIDVRKMVSFTFEISAVAANTASFRISKDGDVSDEVGTTTADANGLCEIDITGVSYTSLQGQTLDDDGTPYGKIFTISEPT